MSELLQVERVISASPEKLFSIWTSCDKVRDWHCGTITDAVMDLRPGGEFRLDFAADENCDVASVSGTYREVIPNQKIVYSWKWNNADWDSLVTVMFDEHENGTLVKVEHAQLGTDELIEGHREGWNNCLNGIRSFLHKTTDTAVPPPV